MAVNRQRSECFSTEPQPPLGGAGAINTRREGFKTPPSRRGAFNCQPPVPRGGGGEEPGGRGAGPGTTPGRGQAGRGQAPPPPPPFPRPGVPRHARRRSLGAWGGRFSWSVRSEMLGTVTMTGKAARRRWAPGVGCVTSEGWRHAAWLAGARLGLGEAEFDFTGDGPAVGAVGSSGPADGLGSRPDPPPSEGCRNFKTSRRLGWTFEAVLALDGLSRIWGGSLGCFLQYQNVTWYLKLGSGRKRPWLRCWCCFMLIKQ